MDIELDLPENPIMTAEMYEEMYAVVQDEEMFERLVSLSEENKPITDLWTDDRLEEYELLLDTGLAVRRSGAGEPYIQITSLGRVIVENGPREGVERLAAQEHEVQKLYGSEE